MVLLEAVRDQKVSVHALSLADRQRLRRSDVASLRKLASDVLPEQKSSARADVLNQYKSALSREGNVAEGAKLFSTHCASCHALNGVGHDVGPDLSTMRSKEPEYWLQNILDPNAAIEPRFVSYEAELADDRAISGVIKNETATTLTIASGNGVTETVFRSKLRKLRALSLSLMPEGLETAIPPEQMADLIAYVRGGSSAKAGARAINPRSLPQIAKAHICSLRTLPKFSVIRSPSSRNSKTSVCGTARLIT